jgi:putative aminopeptidase FrvX
MTDALELAKGLLANPTVPFIEDLPAQHIRSFADERGLTHETDAAGNVVVKFGPGVQGGPRSDARPLVLVAHMDHPGFHVTGTDLAFKGGLMAANALPGAPLHYFRRDERDPIGAGELIEARADDSGRLIGASATNVTGDFAMWGFPGWSVVDGRITTRVCDDLVGCAAILAVLDEIARARPSTCVWGMFTRAEEEGFLGAFEAIRLGTVPKDADVLSLECSKALANAPQGGGVIVRVGDRMSIFDPSLTAAVEAAAAKVDGLRSQRRLMDGGACEATAFCAAGYRASGVAVPLGGYHNARDETPGIAPETVLVDDYLAEVQLLTSLADNPDLLAPQRGEPEWFTRRSVEARRLLGA